MSKTTFRLLARHGIACGVLSVAALVLAGAPGPADAQQPSNAKPADLIPSEKVTIDTKDNVRLVATFYPGSNGKDSAPIIMLHGSGGNRADFDGLAKHLQGLGHAVIAPDLRGHGDSTTVLGADKKLSADTMPVAQYAQMVRMDMEAIKGFLLEQHHNQKLNIDKLVLIGSEVGALVAVNWTVMDWSWPVLATGKQGQDVKAVALISPLDRDKGLRISTALQHRGVREHVSFYIVMGSNNPKYLKQGRQLYKALDRFREDPMSEEEMTLFIDETLETPLQGISLLGEPSLDLENHLARFIELRVTNLNIPWKERKRPL